VHAAAEELLRAAVTGANAREMERDFHRLAPKDSQVPGPALLVVAQTTPELGSAAATHTPRPCHGFAKIGCFS
jgi:hypothetical protein